MSEESSVGVENIIVVMEAAIAVGMDIADALEDGKFGWADTIGLAKNIPDVVSAAKAAKELPDELRDLDDEERDEIVAYFADKFDLDNDELEEKLERVFSVAVGLAGEVVEIIDLVKAFRS